jgi:WD40 repeat protein
MLLELLNANVYAFINVISKLETSDLLSLCKTSPELDSFISSTTLNSWKIDSFSPSQKTFLLPTNQMPSIFVADNAVVAIAEGPHVTFFSISSGLQVSQVTVPGVRPFGKQIEKMILTDDHLAVAVDDANRSRVLLFNRVQLTLSYEHVLRSRGASFKLHSSLMVVGDRLGHLGFLNLSTQGQMMFASDPRQATVHSLDCDQLKTVVSCDDKILVWNNTNTIVTKVINRGTNHNDLVSQVYPIFGGTDIKLANDIVVTPALGADTGMEIWNINSGELVHRVEEEFLHYNLHFPILNLEYSGRSRVLLLDDISPSIKRVFDDDMLNDIWPVDEMPVKQTFITLFHHITLTANYNEHGNYEAGGKTKLIVRSFCPH